MTREEYQKEYLESFIREEYDSMVWGDNLFTDHVRKMFNAGIQCADTMPKPRLVDLSKVWHPAEEEPGFNNPILTEEEDESYYILIRINQCNTWKDYVRTNQVICWAYIEDLLPKGGKL